MPEKMGGLSNGVGRRHPVSMQNALLIAVLMIQICTLQHQIHVQYSAVECTRANAAVRRMAALAPHPNLASRLIRATHEVSFPYNNSRCQWYINNQSSFTPRYIGIFVKNRHFPSSVKLIL